jgi:6-phosphofructokinase 1
VRKKPSAEDCERMLDLMERHDIRYVFYIGGNDSAETTHLMSRAAVQRGQDLRLFHVPKTIDNDLVACDHTPGYGSAARFVALAMMGGNADNRSLGGVKIDVIMGRHAGWLTAAASLARAYEDDGPHLVYVPERAFDVDAFLRGVAETIARHGRCIAAVSEGIPLAVGPLVAAVGTRGARDVDSPGNGQLPGRGALGHKLAAWVTAGVPAAKRVRADTFGYLQRSFYGVVSPQDALEAREVGRFAVRAATSGEYESGSITICRSSLEGEYRPEYSVVELSAVARLTRTMPDEYLVGDDDIAPRFRAYAMPLVGELERPGRLALHRFEG